MPPFYRRINKAKTGRAAAKILYQFLVQNGVPDQLKNWQSQATEAGNLQEAGQAEQVWNQFCQLLDDYVTVLGDHEFVMDDFLDLLKAGFVGASYSQIPSTLDQVTISETGRIHLNDKKITFVIGADDNNIPAKVDNNSLFNDADRDQMDVNLEDDQYLVDTSETMMLGEPYEDYLTFLNPDNELYFSYNLGGDGADTIHQISPYVKRIQDYFGIKTEKFSGRPTAEEVNISQYVGSDRTSLKYLIQAALASKKNKQPLNSAWGTVKQQLEQHSDRQIRDLTKNLLGSLDYQNSPKKLRPEIISGLYGNDIVTSISKLEEFYTDPYEYFLKYGLKLRERDEFEISPANTGQFYHEALDRIVKEINKQQLQLPDLTDQDIHELVTEITSKMIEADVNYQYEILKSSQRMCYITSQLVATVNQMALTMRNQAQHVNMRPKKTEVAFGPGQKYAPLHFDLNDKGQQVNVQGRIDRIDEMKVDDIDYLGIVDYKSGNRDINLSEVYDGTSMQMMTYLDAVLQNITSLSDSEQAELAGALYLHIFDPILKPGEVKNWNEPKQIERELLKKHKYNGLLVSDKTMLKKMGNGDVNAIYPFDFKNNGDLKVTSKVITRDNLQLMLQHTERLIQNAARRIFAGDIQLAPAKYEKQSLIQYSPYKAIMQFDPMLRENNYREIQKLTDQQIWDLLRKEAGEKNE